MSATFASLCSGIEGIGLGLERAGWELRWHAETDPYCIAIHERYWPDVPNVGDITTADWTKVEPVDLLAAGYPCQPFSTAGKMAATEDPRHLWPYVARAVRLVRPRLILLENVPAHVVLGLPEVLGDLAGLGFDAVWSIVPAAAVGAPQRRPRLFVLAYPEGTEREWGGWLSAVAAGTADNREVADVHRCRTHVDGPGDAEPWSCEPDVRRMGDGLSVEMDRARLHALGNSVVPQVAEWIGRRILESVEQVA